MHNTLYLYDKTETYLYRYNIRAEYIFFFIKPTLDTRARARVCVYVCVSYYILNLEKNI